MNDREHYSGMDDEEKPLKHDDCLAGNCKACEAEERASDYV